MSELKCLTDKYIVNFYQFDKVIHPLVLSATGETVIVLSITFRSFLILIIQNVTFITII